MKKFLLVIGMISLSLASFSQRDKEPPVVTNFSAVVSGDIVAFGADVVDNEGVAMVYFYVAPSGDTKFNPQSNKGKYAYGYATQWPQNTTYSGTRYIGGLAPGVYTVRIDAWDTSHNLTREEITIIVT